jgi:hypothetical protein
LSKLISAAQLSTGAASAANNTDKPIFLFKFMYHPFVNVLFKNAIIQILISLKAV